MAAKKNTKKNVKKTLAVVKGNPKVKGKHNTPPETTLGDVIKDAESAIIITVTKGQIDVTAIKNINYAYEAKGLLVGAMDSYSNKPIINVLNNNARALLSHLVNISNKIPEKPKEGQKA